MNNLIIPETKKPTKSKDLVGFLFTSFSDVGENGILSTISKRGTCEARGA